MPTQNLASRLFTGACLTIAALFVGLKLFKFAWAAWVFSRASGWN